MGRLLNSMAKPTEAEPLLVEAVEGAKRTLPKGHWRTGTFLAAYGECLTKLERYAEAEAALLEAHGILETALGAEHGRTIKVIQPLIDLCEARDTAEPGKGYDAKASEWRAKLPDTDPDSRSP